MPSKAFCTGIAKGVWGVVRTSPGSRISWRAHLKRLSPVPSSHCGRWTLILCTVTLDPWMHWCVARTKVMSSLLLTYLHVLEYVFRHFVTRQLAILFRVDVASNPSRPSTEATKGEKCRRCWRQASRYIFFFFCSASCRHFSCVFAEWDLESVLTMRMS